MERRVRTKAIRTKFDGSWGDAKLAFAYWAFTLEARLVDFRSGANYEGQL